MTPQTKKIIYHIPDQWDIIDNNIQISNSACVGKFQKKKEHVRFYWEKYIIAIKKVLKTEENEKEINIINSLEHDNIIKYFACGKDESYYYIYMEWIDNSVLDLLKCSDKNSFNINTIIWITHEVLLAISYIINNNNNNNNNNSIHIDIKPSTIMVDYKNQRVKLIGFGGTFGGNNKSDIWNLACLIITMGGSELPNDEYCGNHKHLNCIPVHFPDGLASIIKYCLNEDNEKRCDVKYLLNHEIFKPLTDNKGELRVYYNSKLKVYILNGNQLFQIYSKHRPPRITNDRLTFEYYLNKPLKPNTIPNNFTHLKFGVFFDQPIKLNDIPNSITQLTFGERFNQRIKPNVIPNSVTKLVFGNSFNQILKPNVIPYGVSQLFLSNCFNQILKQNDIPDSVTQLSLGYDFNQPIKQKVIPGFVSQLRFSDNFNQLLKSNDIPNSVTQLTFGNFFNQLLKPNDIPYSVTQLKFGDNFNQPLNINHIPDSVTQLTFGEKFDQPLNLNVIPNSVTKLEFGLCFNQQLKPNDIPDSVTELTFGLKFNQPLKLNNSFGSESFFSKLFCFNPPSYISNNIKTLSIRREYYYIGQLTSNIPTLFHLIIRQFCGNQLNDSVFKVQKLELLLYGRNGIDNDLFNNFPFTPKLIINGNNYLFDEKLNSFKKINKNKLQ